MIITSASYGLSRHVVVSDLQDDYVQIVRALADTGDRIAPREQATREWQGVLLELENPYRALPTSVGRGLNRAIAAAEALQLVGGWSYPELMIAITRNFEQFRDGGVYHGAYGPRIRPQLPRVLKLLKREPSTRQAIVTIWDPLHDQQPDAVPRDLPCTITLQWLIRDGQLHAHTYMRSNDVWWGLAYDAFQFTQLQITLARLLDLSIGNYFHHVGSFHLYERDLPAVERLHWAHPMEDCGWCPHGVPGCGGRGRVDGRWQLVRRNAQRLLEHRRMDVEPIGHEDVMALDWYADALT